MENQHRHIKTYRELSQTEIDLMNRVKAHEATTAELVKDIRTHLEAQSRAAYSNEEESKRIFRAEPYTWTHRAKEGFQMAYMALVRSIAQPDTSL